MEKVEASFLQLCLWPIENECWAFYLFYFFWPLSDGSAHMYACVEQADRWPAVSHRQLQGNRLAQLAGRFFPERAREENAQSRNLSMEAWSIAKGVNKPVPLT